MMFNKISRFVNFFFFFFALFCSFQLFVCNTKRNCLSIHDLLPKHKQKHKACSNVFLPHLKRERLWTSTIDPAICDRLHKLCSREQTLLWIGCVRDYANDLPLDQTIGIFKSQHLIWSSIEHMRTTKSSFSALTFAAKSKIGDT